MSPKREREQPVRQRRDELDGAPAKMTDLAHAKLAVEARWRGEEPAPADLAACERANGPDDPRCILGRRPDREHCEGTQKSVNIIAAKRTGAGHYSYMAQMCAIQRDDGCNLVEPFGADSHTYLKLVAECYLLSQRELLQQGRDAEAEDCRLAYRSICAWIALTAVPTPRTHDRLIQAGEVRVLPGRKIDHRFFGVAFAGPRFTQKERNRPSGLSTDNACAILLAKELSTVDTLGCTRDENNILKSAILGDEVAARIAAGWMYGTAPGWWYRWRRVLTPDGPASEVVYGVHERVNPEKPSWPYACMMPDGELLRMTPAPRSARNEAWGAGEFRTEIGGGMIRSWCGTGFAEVPELVGEVEWEINIEGAEVRWS